MNKKTYDPATGPKVGDYGYVTGDAPKPGVAKVVHKDGDGCLLVEFLESHPQMHDGNSRSIRCRRNRGWWVLRGEIAPLPIECQIFRDGNTTYCLRGDKKQTTGKAVCDDHDDYDPLTGAIIAMARAYGQNPTTAAYKVLQVLSAIPDKEPEPEKSKAFGLVNKFGWPYGVLGTPTKYKDRKGTPLCVGDTVRVKSKRFGSVTSSWVVETPEEGAFIMGLGFSCDGETGVIDSEWEITWDKSYKELKPGDEDSFGYLRVAGPKCEEAEPPKLRRVLRSGSNKNYGVVGASTELKDVAGEPLYVGDVVAIWSDDSGSEGEEPVVQTSDRGERVMGLFGVDFHTGSCGGYRIRKVKSWETLCPGDKLSGNWIIVEEEAV